MFSTDFLLYMYPQPCGWWITSEHIRMKSRGKEASLINQEIFRRLTWKGGWYACCLSSACLCSWIFFLSSKTFWTCLNMAWQASNSQGSISKNSVLWDTWDSDPDSMASFCRSLVEERIRDLWTGKTSNWRRSMDLSWFRVRLARMFFATVKISKISPIMSYVCDGAFLDEWKISDSTLFRLFSVFCNKQIHRS